MRRSLDRDRQTPTLNDNYKRQLPDDDNYEEHDATDRTEHDENEERRAVVALLRPPGERLQK